MRRSLTAALAGGLALILVGASAEAAPPPTATAEATPAPTATAEATPAPTGTAEATSPPTGTAATSLLGVDLEVTGPVPADLTLLDVATTATTEPDGTPAGPHAEAVLVPLRLDGDELGSARAASDGDARATAPAVALPAGAPVTAELPAIELRADASAERAEAEVDVTTGSLAALTGALGIDVDLGGAHSLVTTEAASAGQGVGISGFGITLGDLLPLQVLELLPLDVLLGIAELLPLGADGLEETVAGLRDSEQLLEETLTGIRAAADELEEALADLAALRDARAAVDEAVAALAALGVSDDVIQDLLDEPSGTVGELLSDPGLVSDVGGGLGSDPEEDSLQDTVDDLLGGGTAGLLAAEGSEGDLSAAAPTPLEQAIVDLAEALGAQADLEAALGTIPEVTATIEALVEQLGALAADLRGLLDDVLAGLLALEDVLPDLAAALEASELLGVEDLELSLTSHAAATAEASEATVACGPGTVRIAGLTLSTPDCHEPIDVDRLTARLAVVGDVLELLPTVADVPEVRLALFPAVVEQVAETDGTVTADTVLTLLDLSLPSVTIDAGAVAEGGLAQLLEVLVADPTAELPTASELTALGLPGPLADRLDAVRVELAALGDAGAEVLAVVEVLPRGLELPTLTTPGVSLTMGASATAAFTAAAGEAPAPGPTPAPPPASPPSDGPGLPSTGGGLVLVGLLALAAGAGLRRGG